MRPTLLRSLAICAVFTSVLATRPARAAAACSSGTVTSPQGNFDSLDPSTSANGRYTAFWSAATDLVAGDTNNRYDVFVVDWQTCAIDRVSVSSAGVAGNSDSQFPSISGDGRYVAFMSGATNLVAGDTNNAPDIFVRDRTTNTTIRASVTNAGAQATGGTLGSVRPDISANGQFVAFMSFATNLVAGDTNDNADVFVRDLVSTTTQRVSVATGGAEGSDGNTNYNKPGISADGRYVAFATIMIGLVPGDTNSAQDIFRHDRQTGTTIRVSVSSAGAQSTNFADAGGPVISDDGRFIAFDSYASNLVAGDTNALYDVFVRDVDTSATSRVSLINQGGQPLAFPWSNSVGPAISGDGRYVAFSSGAEDLVAGDSNGWNDVFIHDRTTGITRRVSTSFDGLQGDFHSQFADISADGQFVAYHSSATALVPNDTNFTDDVFITEWRLVSAPPDVNLIRNGGFGLGMTNWLQFATPDMSYIVSNVTAGVFQFYRVPPPSGTNQAVAFQQTTAQLLPSAAIVAAFDLGNTNNARRRVSVLIHDADFSDLHVCTFWLAANAPMRTYTMRTHTTKAWANATIAFYAATAGTDGGFYRVDNVSMMYSPAAATDRTDCVDPTAPVPPGGLDSADLITNGDFSSGQTGWGLFGQIVSQIAGGQFEFYRPAGTPAGVILQGTGQAMTSGQIMAASFNLGNSSSVRKRVTVLLHEGDFSDLVACTFWLQPNAPAQGFVMHTFTTKAWVNATLSVYPATVGAEQWIQLDNVALFRTPSWATVGTECLEPSPVPTARFVAAPSRPGGIAIGNRDPIAIGNRAGAPGREIRGSARNGALGLQTQGSIRLDFNDRLSSETRLRYWLPPGGGGFEIQVSADGETWRTVSVIEPSDRWRLVTIDPDEWSEFAMYVRVVIS